MNMNLESVNTLIRKRKAKQKKLAEIGPVITGSLSKIYRKCGKSYCRCADGEGHPAHILSYKNKKTGKNTSMYVPKAKLEEVKEWVGNHKKVKELIQEISELSRKIVKLHVTVRRAKEKKK